MVINTIGITLRNSYSAKNADIK